MRKDSYETTSTVTKEEIGRRQCEVINNSKAPYKPKHYALGVIGAKDGVRRHIKENEDKGFDKSKILFFEILREGYKNLLPATTAAGMPLVCADMLDPSKFPKQGLPNNFSPGVVGHVDADFTNSITSESLEIIRKCFFETYPNLVTMTLVGDKRGNNFQGERVRSELRNNVLLQKIQSYLRDTYNASYLSAFRSGYSVYRDESTGHGTFLKSLQRMFPAGLLLLQDYKGVDGANMLGITIIRDIGKPCTTIFDGSTRTYFSTDVSKQKNFIHIRAVLRKLRNAKRTEVNYGLSRSEAFSPQEWNAVKALTNNIAKACHVKL